MRVGEGRGFAVAGREGRYIATVTHCLPLIPIAYSASWIEDRTYKDLLSPLGELPHIWAECLFVNPVADLALLGEPDDQALFKQSNAYTSFVESLVPLLVGGVSKNISVWLLSIEGAWFHCRIDGKWITDASQDIVGGMSGSPIITTEGLAVGVITSSSSTDGGKTSREAGPNPVLIDDLPGWIVRDLGLASKRR